MSTSDNKRIAKNTLFLYGRMIFNLLVVLYTSRIVIKELGVNDYGIFNVVGGLVTLFTLLSSSMTSSISRFLTVDIANTNSIHLQKVFSTSINIQLILGLTILVFIETAGLWFLNFKMNIDTDRLYAANWVLQCSALTFVINMISTPYNACIIAYEKMSAFAYISILETLLKLAVALFLALKIYDSLITYAVLTTCVAIVIRLIYGLYCSKNFPDCHYEPILDKSIFKKIFSFSGWNFIGAGAGVLRSQGVNILMNLFFGTAVNAARGLAVQVYSAISGFATNFMTAINPQIIKTYTNKDLDRTRQLVTVGSRFSFFLLMTISIPIMIIAPELLSLWLTKVPPHTVLFVRLTLILGMSDTISNTFLIVNQATGRIRNYQITVGGLQLLNFPIVYLFYKLGAQAESAYFVAIVISQICLFARVLLVKDAINLKIKRFISDVYIRIIIVSIFAFFPVYYTSQYINSNLLGIFEISVISVVISLLAIIFLGCNHYEKRSIIRLLRNKILNGNK